MQTALARLGRFRYGHDRWDIGGYDVKIIPPPPGVVQDDYPRFVVALGLTSQSLHFDKYKLPSKFGPAPAMPHRKIPAPDYADTKDLT